jgi:hypothetical protein
MSADNKASGGELDSELSQQSLAFLHQARAVRTLQPAAVERIAVRLKGPRRRPRQVALFPAVATLVLVLVAGAAYAVAKGGLRALPVVGALLAPPAPRVEATPAGPRRPAAPKPPLEIPPPALPSAGGSPVAPVVQPAGSAANPAPVTAPAGATVPESAKVAEPATHSVRLAGSRPRNVALRDPGDSREQAQANKPSAAPASTADTDDNPIVAESRSFASVIGPWHRTRNADETLALLDAHERRYPNGHMRLESRVLRAEIYLGQGRNSAALAVLDSLSLSGLPRARELQTVRGELRIAASRCAEGKRDLSDVLEKGVADALAKRAVQAMSHCP